MKELTEECAKLKEERNEGSPESSNLAAELTIFKKDNEDLRTQLMKDRDEALLKSNDLAAKFAILKKENEDLKTKLKKEISQGKEAIRDHASKQLDDILEKSQGPYDKSGLGYKAKHKLPFIPTVVNSSSAPTTVPSRRQHTHSFTLSPICFYCGKKGHIQRHCRHRQALGRAKKEFELKRTLTNLEAKKKDLECTLKKNSPPKRIVQVWRPKKASTRVANFEKKAKTSVGSLTSPSISLEVHEIQSEIISSSSSDTSSVPEEKPETTLPVIKPSIVYGEVAGSPILSDPSRDDQARNHLETQAHSGIIDYPTSESDYDSSDNEDGHICQALMAIMSQKREVVESVFSDIDYYEGNTKYTKRR